MKAIMISIKPKWVAKILNGEKTIEIRKTMPKCDLPIDVYIYCTKSDIKGARENFTFEQLKLLGKVVAKFTLNKVEELVKAERVNIEILNRSCLEAYEFFEYLLNKKSVDKIMGYAWHIDNLIIFDKPKELSEFNHWTDKKIQWYSIGEKVKVMVSLTNAPQNYCYVKVE